MATQTSDGDEGDMKSYYSSLCTSKTKLTAPRISSADTSTTTSSITHAPGPAELTTYGVADHTLGTSNSRFAASGATAIATESNLEVNPSICTKLPNVCHAPENMRGAGQFGSEGAGLCSDGESVTSEMSENEPPRENVLCKMCCEQLADTVFLPCGHLVTCGICAEQLKFCPLCAKSISATVKEQSHHV